MSVPEANQDNLPNLSGTSPPCQCITDDRENCMKVLENTVFFQLAKRLNTTRRSSVPFFAKRFAAVGRMFPDCRSVYYSKKFKN